MIPHLDKGQLEDLYAQSFAGKIQPIAEICWSQIQNGSWVDCRDSRLVVTQAAQKGDMDTLGYFLDVMNGDVDTSDRSGQTILSLAAEFGQVKMTKCLLSHGASPSTPDSLGRTGVWWAARQGKFETVKALVNAEARVMEMDIGIAHEMNREKFGEFLTCHRESSEVQDKNAT